MSSQKKKIISIIISIGLISIFAVIILPGIMFAAAIPEPHSVELNKKSAEKFIAEIENYGKIFELDDCQRYTKRVNGMSVRMSEKESDDEYGAYYKLILENQNIDEQVFEKFRSYLDESGLRSYLRIEEYSLFIVDGFLDNVWGYLYLHSDRELGTEFFKTGHYTIKVVEDLGGSWYRISGS